MALGESKCVRVKENVDEWEINQGIVNTEQNPRGAGLWGNVGAGVEYSLTQGTGNRTLSTTAVGLTPVEVLVW